MEDRFGGHREDRWVHVAKAPFVGGGLAVGVGVPLAKHQENLVLGKLRVDMSKRDAMKTEVPGGEPGKFPFVRHG